METEEKKISQDFLEEVSKQLGENCTNVILQKIALLQLSELPDLSEWRNM